MVKKLKKFTKDGIFKISEHQFPLIICQNVSFQIFNIFYI